MKQLINTFLVFVFGIWLATMAQDSAAHGENPSATMHSEPSQNSRYLGYTFGNDAGVVDVGIQPMWLPVGILTEVMKRDGVLREELGRRGATVRFHPFAKGADINFYLHKGDLEGGFAGDMPVIAACASDQISVVALADLHYTAIVARDSLLVSDLRGHRIGYAFGSNAHYALLQTLAMYGLSESDVTLVPMEVDAMPRAMAQGDIDAFSAWEPTPAIAAKLYGYKTIHRFLSTGYLYFTRSFAERHGDLVSLLVAAEVRALGWLGNLDNNFSQAILWWEDSFRQMAGRGSQLSRKDLSQLARRSLRNLGAMPLIPRDDLLEEGRIGRATRFLRDLGKLPSAPSVRGCFHREAGEKVLAAPLENRLEDFAYQELPK